MKVEDFFIIKLELNAFVTASTALGRSFTSAGSAITLSPDLEPIPVKRKNSNEDPVSFILSGISNLKTNFKKSSTYEWGGFFLHYIRINPKSEM